jgi:signal transduction histidine kinase
VAADTIESNRATILIVEDSPTQAEQLRYVLERHGFAVSVAGNGNQALSLLRERQPSVVISDIVMPGMDGYQLCREIKQDPRLENLPVMLLTSLSNQRDVVRALECGADNFITKPYQEPYIISRIQNLLANKHLKDRAQSQPDLEVILDNERYLIKSDRTQILNLLLSSYEAAIQKNGELLTSRNELKDFNRQLEQKVAERTAALSEEIEERQRAVAERKKLAEQLHHAQKMEALGTLVGGIAHDFNNILTAIIGFGNLMQMKMGQGDHLKPYLEHILSAANRAANLTRSLLTFGRKQEMAARPVELNGIVRAVEKMLLRLLREDIELKCSLVREEMVIMADTGQLEQVMLNMATNARDAMPDGGRLTIASVPFEMDQEFKKTHGYGEPGKYALLIFSDSGQGMEETTRQRIFEPFFTTKEAGKGTGLGLSVCYGIVKEHSGYINCYSEPGRGTTFRIYLPRIEAEAYQAKSLSLAPPPGGNETILLAEDDKQVRHLTRVMLETFGYRVIEAADGEEAIARFIEHRDEIRMIIADLIMPKKNGREVAEEIKKICPGISTLFTSGYPADVFPDRDFIDKSLHFIPKPASPTELLRKVREILDE